MLKRLVLTLAMVSFSWQSNAALVDAGNGLVNDTSQNLTWVKDGNLFLSLANQNGNVSNFTSLVAANSGGWATVGDYGPQNGMMDWFAAQGFVYYLNSISYKGFSNWRLPRTVNSLASLGYPDGLPGNPTPFSSEMAHLFYLDLGQTAGSSLGATPGPFFNVQSVGASAYYWSTLLMPYNAFLFTPADGRQGNSFSLNGIAYIWPVRDGLAPVIPTIPQRISELVTMVSGIPESKKFVKILQFAQTYYTAGDVLATCANITAFITKFRDEVRDAKYLDLRIRVLNNAALLQQAVGCK